MKVEYTRYSLCHLMCWNTQNMQLQPFILSLQIYALYNMGILKKLCHVIPLQKNKLIKDGVLLTRKNCFNQLSIQTESSMYSFTCLTVGRISHGLVSGSIHSKLCFTPFPTVILLELDYIMTCMFRPRCQTGHIVSILVL